MTPYRLPTCFQVFSLGGSNSGLGCLKHPTRYHSLALLPRVRPPLALGVDREEGKRGQEGWGNWGGRGGGGGGGGMRRKRHQTRSKIINRLSAEH